MRRVARDQTGKLVPGRARGKRCDSIDVSSLYGCGSYKFFESTGPCPDVSMMVLKCLFLHFVVITKLNTVFKVGAFCTAADRVLAATYFFINIRSFGELAVAKSPIATRPHPLFPAVLIDIYYSKQAEKYREGPVPCHGCSLYSVCRGCYASTYSFGLNLFEEKDPYCFYAR